MCLKHKIPYTKQKEKDEGQTAGSVLRVFWVRDSRTGDEEPWVDASGASKAFLVREVPEDNTAWADGNEVNGGPYDFIEVESRMWELVSFPT